MEPRLRTAAAAAAALLGALAASAAAGLPAARAAVESSPPALGSRAQFGHNGYHAVTGKSPNTPAAQEGVCNATIPPFFTASGGLRDATLMNYYVQKPWKTRGEW